VEHAACTVSHDVPLGATATAMHPWCNGVDGIGKGKELNGRE